MIKLVFLFLTTGLALVVAVVLIVGVAWIAVAIPVVLVTGTGYGLVALNRRWARAKAGREIEPSVSRSPGTCRGARQLFEGMGRPLEAAGCPFDCARTRRLFRESRPPADAARR